MRAILSGGQEESESALFRAENALASVVCAAEENQVE